MHVAACQESDRTLGEDFHKARTSSARVFSLPPRMRPTAPTAGPMEPWPRWPSARSSEASAARKAHVCSPSFLLSFLLLPQGDTSGLSSTCQFAPVIKFGASHAGRARLWACKRAGPRRMDGHGDHLRQAIFGLA